MFNPQGTARAVASEDPAEPVTGSPASGQRPPLVASCVWEAGHPSGCIEVVSIHAADSVLDQAAVAGVRVDIGHGEGGGDPAAGPVDESVELEQVRRFLDDANPGDFNTS